MKLVLLLILGSAFCGCTLTPNVDTRTPGQQWHYFGDLSSLYRDETKGSPVALVWLEQVQFTRVNPSEFQKAVQTSLTQGYRKIGFISVRSQYFVDPYEAKKLAADKGARLVIGCWFSVHNARAKSNTVEYWYQMLDKAAPTAPGVVPPALPLAPPRSGLY